MRLNPFDLLRKQSDETSLPGDHHGSPAPKKKPRKKPDENVRLVRNDHGCVEFE